MKGKEETPFLLKRITELTRGESLAASKFLLLRSVMVIIKYNVDIALVKNNAKIGGQIAVELSKLKN